MSVAPVTRGTDDPPATAELARLHRASRQMEGLFLSQLFRAMRETVPAEGTVDASPGRELFTAMLDERLADIAAARSERGLGEALFRQLSERLRAVNAARSP
jgi:flagellar protein FlgJ